LCIKLEINQGFVCLFSKSGFFFYKIIKLIRDYGMGLCLNPE